MVTLVFDLRSSIVAAERFLLHLQNDEGLWPDFTLTPGASGAWTTAVGAMALAQPPTGPRSIVAVGRAIDALHGLRQREGWGYNLKTAADADTTAWVLQLLGLTDDLRGVDGLSLLGRFLDERGAAHTFAAARFGTWNLEHPDVTPVVGLALLTLGAPWPVLDQVRDACLGALGATPPWRAFWWTTDAYAVARNLEFLDALGDIPALVAPRVRSWLATVTPRSVFESAQLLTSACRVSETLVSRFATQLVASQRTDGSWPPSSVLRVPPQRGSATPPVVAAGNGTFTTAMILLALKDCYRRGSALA